MKIHTCAGKYNNIFPPFSVSGIPSVTSMAFKDGLTLGVGTATGQVMLFDIRSSSPLLVKDHYNSLPIKDVEFCPSENMVYSMDEKVVKIWNQDTVR